MAHYIDAAAFYGNLFEKHKTNWQVKLSLGEIQDELYKFPHAKVAPIAHEYWVITGEYDGIGRDIKCSRCGYGVKNAYPKAFLEFIGHRYCGCCGAKMEGAIYND